MASDWIPGFFYGNPIGVVVPFVGGIDFVFPLVGTGLGLDPAGNQVGMPDTDPDDILIHRLVGQCDFNNVSFEAVQIEVAIRFTVGLFTSAGTVEVFTETLNDAADANESFTHERRFRLDAGFSTTDAIVDPAWSMYDLKSKRTLRAAEIYCAVVNLTAISAGADGALFMTHFWRAWASWKG